MSAGAGFGAAPVLGKRNAARRERVGELQEKKLAESEQTLSKKKKSKRKNKIKKNPPC